MDAAAVEDNSQIVDQFIAITGVDTNTASFFLESHNFDLESALHSFYDDPTPQHPNPTSNPSRRPTQIDDRAGDDDDDDDDYMPEEEEEEENAPPPPPVTAVAGRSRGEKRPARASRGRSNIRGFGDLNRSPGSDDDDDEDEDEKGQEFYTGGERSGMLVQDPPKGNRRHGVDSIFEQARLSGATSEHYQPSSTSRSFTGIGRTLAGESVQSAPPPPEDVVRNIYFWRNGFTIDDGPLRRFDDPQNGPFLESIQKSECPKELEPADKKTRVHVNLIRREDNYQEPVRRRSAFQGVGRALGSGESSESSVKESTKASEPSGSARSESQLPSVGLTVDDSLPCTTIQLRLADGTRMVARFNTSHTIGHIRAFIDASRPEGRHYQLQTVDFPPQQLNDLTKTIEEAGLANSVVIQRNSNP